MACGSCGCACQIVLANGSSLPGNGNAGTPYVIDLTTLLAFSDGCGYHWQPIVSGPLVTWALSLDFDPIMFACTGGGAGVTSMRLSAKSDNYASRRTTVDEEGLYVPPPKIRGFSNAIIAPAGDGSVSVPVTAIAAGSNVTVTSATVGNQTTWTINSTGGGGGGTGTLQIIDDTGAETGFLNPFECITHSDSIHWIIDEYGCLKGFGTAPPDELTIKTISGLLSVDFEATIASYGAGGAIVAPLVGDLAVSYDPVGGVARLSQLSLVYGKTFAPTATSVAGVAGALTGETVGDAGTPDGTANVYNNLAGVRHAEWLNSLGVQVKGRWHLRIKDSEWVTQVVAGGNAYTPASGLVRVQELRTQIGTNATPLTAVQRARVGGSMAYPGQVLGSAFSWLIQAGAVDIWTDEITVPGTGTTAAKTVTLDVQFAGLHEGSASYPAGYATYWVVPTLVAEFVISGPA